MPEHFRGNPDFPLEPEQLLVGQSTNDTDVFYILDPTVFGTTGVTLGAGLINDETGVASAYAGTQIFAPLWGRFRNVATTDNPLAVYLQRVPNSGSD